MLLTPEHEYPASRPIVPFTEWLDVKFGRSKMSRHIPDENHFETRAAYAEYVVWTFEDPVTWLIARYSLDEIAEGFWDAFCHYLGSVPSELGRRADDAVIHLFIHVFEPYTSGAVSGDLKRTRLDEICYMWGETSPFHVTSGVTMVNIARRFLFSTNATLQEAMLHALNHIIQDAEIDGSQEQAEEAKALIKRYVESGEADDRLFDYAKEACAGKCL